MRRISIMATYPARAETVAAAIASIAAQVDKTVVVLNQYEDVPPQLQGLSADDVEFVLCGEDLRDTGKFCRRVDDRDQIVLCDDDIIYPPDYVARLGERWEVYRPIDAVVGVHGVIYSDFFDGDPGARLVHEFRQRLDNDEFVNQLGTGTVLCGGHQMPDFAFMRSSSGFVDLRFAIHCARQNYPRVCISRDQGWMRQLPVDGSLFDTFTRQWPPSIVAEAQQIAGFRFLPVGTPGDFIRVSEDRSMPLTWVDAKAGPTIGDSKRTDKTSARRRSRHKSTGR